MVIAGGLLVPVVVFIVIISIAAVRRGEIAMHGGVHDAAVHSDVQTFIPDARTGAVAAKPQKQAAGPASDEISVSTILVLGVVLFGLAMAALMAVSVIGHLM
jgi:hypothetical protein